MKPAATTSLAVLLSLVGVSVSNAHCTLNAEQLIQLGRHLRMLHPSGTEVACLSGGLLHEQNLSTKETASVIVPAANPRHDLSFLAIAGPKGALTLLAGQEDDYYRTYLVADADQVDRVILVLSQYIGSIYQEHVRCDKATQASFITKLIVTLLTEPLFRTLDLAALLPTEIGWIDMARDLKAQTDSDSLLTLPAVNQFLRASGVTRALLGLIEGDQLLRIIAADANDAPSTLPIQGGVLANALNNRRLTSVPPRRNPSGALRRDDVYAWAGNDALTALPLIRNDRLWGMLLVASKHPITAKARADLHSYGVLLTTYVDDSSAYTGSFASLSTTNAHFVEDKPTQALVPTTKFMNGTKQQAAKSKHQTQQCDLSISSTLLDHLSDGVIITDTRGRIIACNQAAMQWFRLSNSVVGSSLIECDVWSLTSLLSNVLMGEDQESQAIKLPDGRSARATVVETGPELWAFVIQAPSGHA